MIKKIILTLMAIFIVLLSLHVYKDNNLSTAKQIEVAVSTYLSTGEMADFFEGQALENLEHFKEKFEAENFDSYRLESFQAENDKTVYVMLIVDPIGEREKGIVLYMNFHLRNEAPIEIEELIISNWVVILNQAKQF